MISENVVKGLQTAMASLDVTEETKDTNSLFKELVSQEQKEEIPAEEKPKEDNRPEWEKRSASNHEEFCDWELQKAHLKNLENPDFDFRDYYEKGQTIYFISLLNGSIKTKEMMRLKVRTVYPRLIVALEEKSCCQCIGYESRSYIFTTTTEASEMYDTIDLEDEKEVEKLSIKTDDKETYDKLREAYEELEREMLNESISQEKADKND